MTSESANDTQAPQKSRRYRGVLAVVLGFVGAGLFVFVLESFFVLGVVTPVTIAGSSMAPTLAGPHVSVTCPDCNWSFDVGGDQLPGPRPMLCPDCRRPFFGPDELPLEPGESVVVSRTRFAFREPKRWEIVVFRCPDDASQLCVKRVVGLPGETVEFRRGDLLIHGKLKRKSLEQQLELRQLVHAERLNYQLWTSDSEAWSAQTAGDTQGWKHQGPGASTLVFHPPGPVTDDLACNQRATRPLNPVYDLMITCEVTGRGNLQFTSTHSEQSLQSKPIAMSAKTQQLVFSLFDQQMLLARGGSIVETRPQPRPWSAAPVLSLVATGDVVVSNLRVWRDVYYHTRPVDRHLKTTLPTGECFVVGDNVAISEDSRTWPHAGLRFDAILGGLW